MRHAGLGGVYDVRDNCLRTAAHVWDVAVTGITDLHARLVRLDNEMQARLLSVTSYLVCKSTRKAIWQQTKTARLAAIYPLLISCYEY